MNVFVLDNNLTKNAEYHCDKHCVKLILEATQLVSTTRHILGLSNPYLPTHKNHPWRIFTGTSLDNYVYVTNYGLSLCQEYSFRYDKTHKCQQYLQYFLQDIPKNLLNNDTNIPVPQCMPNNCKVLDDPVQAYRNYYKNVKVKAIRCNWTKRNKPEWLN